MKIAVVGIGGVGGYIGAKLIKSNLAEVKLFAREKQQEVIKKEGLKIIDSDEEFVVKPDFLPLNEKEIFDVLFIAVKSYSLKEVCFEIEKYTDENSIIIPLANGVGHKETIEKYLKNRSVCYGCVYVISHKKSMSVIVKKSPLFYLIFGSKKITKKMRELADILNKSSLKCKLSENAEYECWKKYLFIAPFATMTSYFDEPMDLVFKKYPEVLNSLLFEIKSVANALNIPITEQDIQKVIKQAENLPLNSKTSMQLDFEKNAQTELESLCGYIVKKAKKHNLEVKELQKMYEALKKRD